MKFWNVLGIWPGWMNSWKYYKYYSYSFLAIFVVLYVSLYTINFIFLPLQMDILVEEIIFYLTEVSVASKALTFLFARDKIDEMLSMLESKTFQPTTDDGMVILKRAKRFIVRYWKIVAVVSIISDVTHDSSMFIKNMIGSVRAKLPVCSYVFLTDDVKEKYFFPLYMYQSMGMHFHMLYNVNIDTFFLGLMILVIAQLDILDLKLRNLSNISDDVRNEEHEDVMEKLKDCVIHFDQVSEYVFLLDLIRFYLVENLIFL